MAAEVKSIFRFPESVPFAPRDYITPGGPMEIIKGQHGQPHFALVRWGLVPGWTKEMRSGRPLINARAETILEKPSFEGAMKHRRCLVPADGYYEWQGDVPGHKQPFHITRPDDGLFAFAGIWEHWMTPDGSELESAAIITTTANENVAPIHHRMPVVIHQKDYTDWLDSEHIMARRAVDLLQPAPLDYFTCKETTINRRVRKPKPDQLSLF
jgi:putative SOS response-associated peptidase YedK